jgi:hypothetical protein
VVAVAAMMQHFHRGGDANAVVDDDYGDDDKEYCVDPAATTVVLKLLWIWMISPPNKEDSSYDVVASTATVLMNSHYMIAETIEMMIWRAE